MGTPDVCSLVLFGLRHPVSVIRPRAAHRPGLRRLDDPGSSGPVSREAGGAGSRFSLGLTSSLRARGHGKERSFQQGPTAAVSGTLRGFGYGDRDPHAARDPGRSSGRGDSVSWQQIVPVAFSTQRSVRQASCAGASREARDVVSWNHFSNFVMSHGKERLAMGRGDIARGHGATELR